MTSRPIRKNTLNFLKCVYEADRLQQEGAGEISPSSSAKHFGLTPAEVKEILTTSLAYTPLEEALAYMGKAGERANCTRFSIRSWRSIWRTAQPTTSSNPTQQIDNSVINKLGQDADNSHRLQQARLSGGSSPAQRRSRLRIRDLIALPSGAARASRRK